MTNNNLTNIVLPSSGQDLATRIETLVDRLFPYQQRWVKDLSRRKFGLMARQVGKDFSSGFEGLADCALAEAQGRKTDWIIAAPSERQSLESLRRWKEWCEIFHLAFVDEQVVREGGSESLLKSVTITFPHGSRVMAVPGKPETVRGFSANVLFTEFAFFEQPEQTWRAVYGSTANSMRGGPKKIRIITTPNGLGGMAYALWNKNYQTRDNGKWKRDNESGKPVVNSPLSTVHCPVWSCHFVDIHAAVRDGLPVDIADLKAGMDDPEGWAQEFECQFLDLQATLLPYELIATCESPEAGIQTNPMAWGTTGHGPIVLGLDYARKKHLSVCWAARKLGDVLHTLEVLEMADLPTPEQIAILRPRIRAASRVCLDVTGSGTGMGDYLVKEFGEWDPGKHKTGKIELCNFTNEFKNSLCSNMRQSFELRGVRIPVSRAVREDLHSVARVVTPSGNISYRAQYTPDGHADRAMALALAIRAASQQRPRCSIQVIPRDWSGEGLSVAQRNMEAMNRRAFQRWGIKPPPR